MTKDRNLKIETITAHTGLDPKGNHGIPNPPIYHTSTIIIPTLEDYRLERGKYTYGRTGTPTSDAVEGAIAAVYGADHVISVSSGLAAITAGVLSVVKSGDAVLFPDSLYGSGRRFVEVILPQMGITPIFYDPLTDAPSLTALITKNTSLIYIETPGSLTFEIQDTKAIVEVAKAAGCLVAADNTWGTPLHFDAFGHGIDIVIEAGTKYISGHSDVSIGFVAANGDVAKRIRRYAICMGLCVAPDELYLALRGLRTMPLRLRQSAANGIALARFIEQQPEVIAMLHPALKSHPQHDLWKRDFTGACGLFSYVLDASISDAAVDDMVNNLRLFGIGASWGGYESLISEGNFKRTVSQRPDGRVIRVYAGIEDIDDLLTDIKDGFERMRAKM
ncbi:MAG: cystathionine beta-lyase [Candidatus Puniceispirillales bacterium WSBS_2018_MAG_OTU23]